MDRDWWRGAVLYQIYPRSFQDTDGDGVGDLQGITHRLDYIKSLGVDGVWISPFFKSPMKDFGYDVADYCAIDPLFGGMDDFDAMLASAHRLGLKVVIDQVWSHSSDQHAWFQESRQSRDNPRADWYVWADPKSDGAPPNNWQAWFGGPAWTWEPRRRQYYLHNFLPSQPDLNFRSSAVQDAVLGVARFWLDKGVDGFRLDVANYYVHDAQLRDNPPSGDPAPALPRDMQVHQYNSCQPETLEFIARLRRLMDGYGDRMTVGELAPGSFGLMRDYTLGHKRLHTAYAFDFLKAWPGVERMAEILSQWEEGPDGGWPSWAFSNHDVARVATRWGNAIGAPPASAAILFLSLLLSLRGTIFLYQGEELGLPEADVPFEKLKDPWGIAGWPAFKGRDGCRTPMPWTREHKAGFTTGEPWLPLSEPQLVLAVEAQQGGGAATLNVARELIALRAQSAALATGSLKVVGAADGVLMLERSSGADRVVCAFNSTTAGRRLPANGEVLWANSAEAAGGQYVLLGPFGSIWLRASAA
jgi:alpha-glucosidase